MENMPENEMYEFNPKNPSLKPLVEFIAKSIVDRPEDVNVTEVSGENTHIYELRVSEDDRGKIIGKQGRTAQSLRTLLAAAASKRNQRSILEILE